MMHMKFEIHGCSGWLVGCFGLNGPLRQGERGWLIGCFGCNGPLRQYFSLYPAVSQRQGERGKKG